MSRTRQDLSYYEQLSVQITPRNPPWRFPNGLEQRLRSSLPNFGTVWAFRMVCIRDGEVVTGRPNLAVVVFTAPLAVTKILGSSHRDKSGSLWQTNSITAHTLDRTGPVAGYFSTEIAPGLGSPSRLNGQSSDSQTPPQPAPNQPTHPNPKDVVPPPVAQHSRITGRESNTDGITTTGSHPPPLESPHIAGLAPGSSEWMRARITQLEAELDNARAVRDMALSEHDVIRQAYQAEQSVRREVTAQKSAAEAELSRKGGEQSQLRAELDNALSRESVLSKDNNALRGMLTLAEAEFKRVEPLMSESEKCMGRVKALEIQLEETKDRTHKLQMQKSQLEQQSNSDNIELTNTKEKLKKVESELKELKVNHASTQELLKATQMSLGSMEQKYSLAHTMYESTKEKLGTYKERLENKEAAMRQLKDTLTPEVYRSLGATYEALGGFLSVVGLPQPAREGNAGPKTEYD